MQNFKSIEAEIASSRFRYEPESGNLIWQERQLSDFKRPSRGKSWNSRYAGQVAGHRHICTAGKTYIQVRVDKVMHYAHRIIWVLCGGEIPAGSQVDHIDGDGANNRLENLRLVTNSENKRNQRRHRTNTTGYTGVHFNRKSGRYHARAAIGDRTISLGAADSAEEAYELRKKFDRENGFHENHGTDRPL